jgi:hypothetical protein
MKTLKITLVCFGLVFLAGCTLRLVDFTVISTKNVQVTSKSKGKRVTGEDCVPVVFVPIGMPNMEEAIDRAIESAGPQYDALVDGVMYHTNQSFIVGKVCYKVEGTPIDTSVKTSMKNGELEKLMRHSKRYSVPSGG